MNERIQALLHQCSVPDDQAEEYSKSKGLVIPDQKLDVAKFAQLIVRECIGCCEQAISDPVPESVDTWLNGGSQCIDEIKRHFGVEE